MRNAGVIGVIASEDDELVLRLYATEHRGLVAVVIGSPPYLARALLAAGLAPAPIGLTKDRNLLRDRAFVSSEPANGNAQVPREPDERLCLNPAYPLAAFKP
jgi:hypothetical protein